MFTFLSKIARAIIRIFAPAKSDLVEVGYQPITDDIYRINGSACHFSDLEISS
ncbi:MULTISPECIES: hypothetical protein [unclassified Synechococcus]|jgi:hypothetical protein|uniref:hypothetical protein n=1 Tax=unclassified Synechococcus TaxID=2626047 RepID=UPI0039C3D293